MHGIGPPRPSSQAGVKPPKPWTQRLRQRVLGAPKRLEERGLFHSLSLIPLMAWVGLGGDGLSSSAYGPDEAFRALQGQSYLALPLAGAVALTVLLISACYMRVIEKFPTGGGGYVVATKLLSPRIGVTAACALLVDYVLTVSVSISAGADALLSMVPGGWHALKLPLTLVAVGTLVLLNLRGVKESITALLPIFVAFLVSHVALIGCGLIAFAPRWPGALQHATDQASGDINRIGLFGVAALLARAYSMGAGTFTGIEAVSNGLPVLREPRVENGKRTMVYMALSLAFTAAGVLICYWLTAIEPEAGKTMNAVLAEKVFGALHITPAGHHFMVGLTLAAEGALLFVAAQTGFMDGPRVMSNMASDRWIPRHFANLSDRLTTQNGVLMVGGAAAVILVGTGSDTHALVVMYSINVFLVFTLTTLGMARAALQQRAVRDTLLHVAGFFVCAGVLAITLYEKFSNGGWLTVLITGALVGCCLRMRESYERVIEQIKQVDKEFFSFMKDLPNEPSAAHERMDPTRPTAVVMVGNFGGLGMHAFMSVLRMFPHHFKQVVFVGVALVDSQTLKHPEEVAISKDKTRGALLRYVALAHRLGLAATFEMGVDTDVHSTAVPLCLKLSERYSKAVFFAGKLMFGVDEWFQRLLHNEKSLRVQRALHRRGLPMMTMPIRVNDA